MATIAEKPTSVRLDGGTKDAIAALRRKADPIPTVSDVIRRAVMELYEREAKPNGKHRNGK